MAYRGRQARLPRGGLQPGACYSTRMAERTVCAGRAADPSSVAGVPSMSSTAGWSRGRTGCAASHAAIICPRRMAIGALLAAQKERAFLLAGLIFLQSLPEGFAAFREIVRDGAVSGGKIVLLFASLALLGPACAAIGFTFLAEMPEGSGLHHAVCGGRILYLIFQDVAPESHEGQAWSPALGAVRVQSRPVGGPDDRGDMQFLHGQTAIEGFNPCRAEDCLCPVLEKWRKAMAYPVLRNRRSLDPRAARLGRICVLPPEAAANLARAPVGRAGADVRLCDGQHRNVIIRSRSAAGV